MIAWVAQPEPWDPRQPQGRPVIMRPDEVRAIVKFTLKIESDNAAMVDSTRGEVARILEEVARRVLDDGESCGSMRDSNGNRVGSFELTVTDES